MNTPYFEITQTQKGWQAVFAYQAIHRPGDEWIKMRWGFNALALLDEALDRYKLFIDSQTVNELEFRTGTVQNNALALRGIHSPELGLKMVLLGKSCAPGREKAQQCAEQYAREVSSTFPYDFILVPAETENDFQDFGGNDLLTHDVKVAQIQRGLLPLPAAHAPPYLMGLWQSGPRSNEQIWRALSAMPQPALFNILIQPSFLYPNEKHILLDIKKRISDPGQNNESISAYIPWVEDYIKRRLEVWKRFFLVQVHLVIDGRMENLIRSIGSVLTQDSDKLSLPGYQVRYPVSPDEGKQWLENIRSLDLTESSPRPDDLADTEEVFSIFRFPYRQEMGLPGANFSEMEKGPENHQGD